AVTERRDGIDGVAVAVAVNAVNRLAEGEGTNDVARDEAVERHGALGFERVRDAGVLEPRAHAGVTDAILMRRQLAELLARAREDERTAARGQRGQIEELAAGARRA